MDEFFSNIPKIQYEGANTDNLLAFRHYNPTEIVGNKTMQEHLRFSFAYWHSLTGQGNDPFGMPTIKRPWDSIQNPIEKAKARVYALAEITTKLSIPFFCFHDFDIVDEADTLVETEKRLDSISDILHTIMKDTGLQLLWGTSNLFSHPRFMNGAATSPQAEIFTYAAAKVKKAIDITHKLGGLNYVFWGGREGYETLLNTNLKRELDNLATFLSMARDYAKSIGFTGQLLIEPKPKEPTKHQYDYDAASVIGFLKHYNLDKDFTLNLEVNHATLSGHTMHHEMYLARIHDMLGSLDANQGDMLLGWDTDQYATNIYTSTLMMIEVLKNGGIAPGGLNFDAKLRRPSTDSNDLFYGHISSMDTFAIGLKAAHSLLSSNEIENFVQERYESYNSDIGSSIVNNTTTLKDLHSYALQHDTPTAQSGKQEMLEIILNKHILSAQQ